MYPRQSRTTHTEQQAEEASVYDRAISAGGGGGGSSFAAPGATSVSHEQGVNVGNGSVTMSVVGR